MESGKSIFGFSAPFSPDGAASPAPFPPWHYVGDYIVVEYRADPKAVRAALPADFSLGDDAGRCALFFSDCQYATDAGEEFLDPAVSQYRECLLAIAATFDGKPSAFMPYIFVDNDNAMIRGHIQGMSKQIGTVRMTRAYDVESRASPMIRAGGRFGATLSHRDRMLCRAVVTLEKATDTAPNRMLGRLINRRHFADLSRARHTHPLVHQYVRQLTRDVRMTNLWEGAAQLEFMQGAPDGFAALAPVEVGRGYRYTFAMTIDDLAVVKDLKDSPVAAERHGT
jgi:acetoacetate decarboxylase